MRRYARLGDLTRYSAPNRSAGAGSPGCIAHAKLRHAGSVLPDHGAWIRVSAAGKRGTWCARSAVLHAVASAAAQLQAGQGSAESSPAARPAWMPAPPLSSSSTGCRTPWADPPRRRGRHPRHTWCARSAMPHVVASTACNCIGVGWCSIQSLSEGRRSFIGMLLIARYLPASLFAALSWLMTYLRSSSLRSPRSSAAAT